MSFPTATTSTPLSPANAAADTSWQNDRFINILMPDSEGKPVSLATIKLKLSNPVHAKFIEFLDADLKNTDDAGAPATVNLDKFMDAVTVNYQTKEKKDREFDFMS